MSDPLSTTPKAFGVLGSPVGHSRSPPMHNAAFAALGLPHRYFAFEVAPARLGEAVFGARALGLGGLNITVPHKCDVTHYCDGLSAEAARIGAANTVCWRGSELRGHNTDGRGFLDALGELGGPPARTAVVLGGGGAARAVVDALLHRDRPCTVTWVSRTPTRLPRWPGSNAVGYESLSSALEEAELLVNTTTVGMAANPSAFPVDPAIDRLPGSAAVVDLVYPRAVGGMLDVAARRGLRVQDGRAMLLWQGIAALELWLERPLPSPVREAMRQTLYT